VKCDEDKPCCQRCLSTGRACDGYEVPYRFVVDKDLSKSHASPLKPSAALQSASCAQTAISPEDIDLLNRYFSTKTIFDVELHCDEEARQVLEASLTDPTIRRAISSLKALREDLDASRNFSSAIQQSSARDYGMQQYCLALQGLVSNLALPGSADSKPKSALLCCQIFISIEQVRGDYASMAQHIIQGLGILHEYHARPSLDATGKVIPAHDAKLPLLDVFIIKLFMTPCKFADAPITVAVGSSAPACPVSIDQEAGTAESSRRIAPNMRAELEKIAASTLELLKKVSLLRSTPEAQRLVQQKSHLLDSLSSWLARFDQSLAGSQTPELLSVSFTRLFHQVLKIILLGTLSRTPDLEALLRTERERYSVMASDVGDRAKNYRMRLS
jgi:hypothetical protein